MKVIAIAGTKKEDTDFLFNAVLKVFELSGNLEGFTIVKVPLNENPKDALADLIFTQINNSQDTPMADYMCLAHWIRQPRHAYCMVSEEHPMGLHNYNNFKNIIIPLNLVFKPLRFDVDKEGKPISPATLIEALRPSKNEQEN